MSLSTYCPKLTSLDFSNTNLNVPEACALGDNLTLLVYGKKRFHLDLSETYFDTEASIAFCKKVIDKLLSSTDTSSITELEYSSCALYLNRNPIGYNGFLALFKMLSTKLCPITNLQIKDTHNSTKEINSADLEADNVMGSRLTTLCLGDNQFTGEIYARALEVAVRVDVLIHLKSLDLSNALTYNMDTNGVLLTTLLPCLASHCPSLATLDLSKNNLGVPGARPLGETFPLFTTSRKEFTLHLTKANFDCAALLVFCEAIKLSSIEEVPFSTENYDIENVMYLNQNPLNYDTLLAMFSALRCRSCQITTLYLNNTDYTTISGTKGILPSIDADGMSSCLTTLQLSPSLSSW